MRHVLMDGDNVDFVFEQRFQNRLQFVFGHGAAGLRRADGSTSARTPAGSIGTRKPRRP